MIDNEASSQVDTRFSVCDWILHALSDDLDRTLVEFPETGEVITVRDYKQQLSQYVQALEEAWT